MILILLAVIVLLVSAYAAWKNYSRFHSKEEFSPEPEDLNSPEDESQNAANNQEFFASELTFETFEPTPNEAIFTEDPLPTVVAVQAPVEESRPVKGKRGRKPGSKKQTAIAKDSYKKKGAKKAPKKTKNNKGNDLLLS